LNDHESGVGMVSSGCGGGDDGGDDGSGDGALGGKVRVPPLQANSVYARTYQRLLLNKLFTYSLCAIIEGKRTTSDRTSSEVVRM